MREEENKNEDNEYYESSRGVNAATVSDRKQSGDHKDESQSKHEYFR